MHGPDALELAVVLVAVIRGPKERPSLAAPLGRGTIRRDAHANGAPV